MYYNKILGGIVGDIIGSTRERKNVKNENFELLPEGSCFTDDTVMTLAVAEWLMTDPAHSERALVECMQRLGRKYPNAGYGGMFRRWLSTDNPEPYNSFGNGSAMRVSPVGLYANSMEEALELARITASVSHNHPEGIKGAQAIAASIYIKRTEMFDVNGNIKRFVEQNFGYDLDVNIRDIRDDYSFDVTCQGSVPIAIMAFLQEPHNAEKAIRLAVSMGGDSDTIGCMTASIAATERPHVISSSSLSHEIEDKCRALLPADLLDINDRFMDFISRPLYQSYEVRANGIIYAGEYPGDKNDELAKQKIEQMHHFGIRHFIDLTEDGELRPYSHLLPAGTTYTRFPIADCGAPKSIESVQSLLLRIEELKKMDGYVYVHCWGGVGRTGTIIACYLSQNWGEPDLSLVLDALRKNFSEMPKSAYKKTPETKEQIDFIERFIVATKSYKETIAERYASEMSGVVFKVLKIKYYPEDEEVMATMSRKEKSDYILKLRLAKKYIVVDDEEQDAEDANQDKTMDKADIIKDKVRGCLMAGATGDALGYEVEFMSRRAILSRFGEQGITKFTLDNKGKALISDDTQMTLFTANGLLNATHLHTEPRYAIVRAYLDWYYTQIGRTNKIKNCWIGILDALHSLRAPGNTCMSALEAISRGKEPCNYSKGCGGIMRVAPIPLFAAANNCLDDAGVAQLAADAAECTHQHPLGFLPASLFAVLLYKVVPMSPNQVREEIDSIVTDTVNILDRIYKGKYESDKQILKELTEKAMQLAHSDATDADAIRELGEGWVAEETWAIALYSAVRHIDSVEDAIIASVNHDGDSDSTGSVCGNIMGAIYGYEHIKERNIFCPEGKLLEDTLELSEIILALANDLSTGCIISECNPIDTPEKQQWYERYCEMKPAGIRNN